MAEAQCLPCWVREWFECDAEVGSAMSSLAIHGHGGQYISPGPEARKVIRALDARSGHYNKMPNAACSCDSAATHGDDPEKEQTLGTELVGGLRELSEAVATGKPLSENFAVTTAHGDDPAVELLDALDRALKAIEPNKHPMPEMFDEACNDMAEFLATHQPSWFIIKDKAELEEAAREAGFVSAERDV